MMKRFSPNTYNELSREASGVILEGETIMKNDGKKSKWKTKDISENKEVINNDEWSFEGLGSSNK